jgi:hypothetical protein
VLCAVCCVCCVLGGVQCAQGAVYKIRITPFVKCSGMLCAVVCSNVVEFMSDLLPFRFPLCPCTYLLYKYYPVICDKSWIDKE